MAPTLAFMRAKFRICDRCELKPCKAVLKGIIASTWPEVSAGSLTGNLISVSREYLIERDQVLGIVIRPFIDCRHVSRLREQLEAFCRDYPLPLGKAEESG